MRTIDEIVADAQKAVAHSLHEAFDAGRTHTSSELKRRMMHLFEDLISSQPETHHAETGSAHEEQASSQEAAA